LENAFFSFSEIRLSCSLIVSDEQTNKYGEGSGRIWGLCHLIVMIRETGSSSYVSAVVVVAVFWDVLYCCIGGTYSTLLLLLHSGHVEFL
jgi:hypothetical protein